MEAQILVTHTHTQDLCRALTQGGRFDGDTETFVVGPLMTGYTKNGRGMAGVNAQAVASGHVVPFTFQTRIARNGRGQPKDITDALTSSDGGTHADSKPHVAYDAGVRRLTPRECERLQGFPDDWTRYNAEGKELADGPRYRMLGNAVNRNVAEWIGRRIVEATQ